MEAPERYTPEWIQSGFDGQLPVQEQIVFEGWFITTLFSQRSQREICHV